LVMLGECVLPFEVVRSIIGRAPQAQPLQENMAEPRLSDLKECKLSAREAQILGCLTEGASNKIIARKFDVTEATVKVHVKAILRKIGAANRTQAAMWRHRQLNGLRQVQPFRSIRSDAHDTGHLGSDPKSLSADTAMISGVGVGRAAEEVCNLIVDREKALGLPG